MSQMDALFLTNTTVRYCTKYNTGLVREYTQKRIGGGHAADQLMFAMIIWMMDEEWKLQQYQYIIYMDCTIVRDHQPT